MKTYNVKLIGQQKHIQNKQFENQTETQVNAIIEKYKDDQVFKFPVCARGESQELNNDYYIILEEVK